MKRVFQPTDIIDKHQGPRAPGVISKADVRAIRHCWEGIASPGDQRLALEAIIYSIARADDLGFYPDDKGGERESNFAQGMRHAGMQTRKIAMFGNTYLADDKEGE